MKIVNYLFLISWITLIRPCYAIEVTPMVVTFSPDSYPKSASSLVYNNLPRDIAFDIQVFEIQFSREDPNQDPRLIPVVNQNLWIFPPSLYLLPGQAQRIQFKWLSDALPETDKSYQVSLVEQPVGNNLYNSSKLTLLLNFNLIVHIDQRELNSNLVVGQPYNEGTYIMAKVINKGAGSSRLSDYEIKLIDTDTKVLIEHILKQQLKAQGYDVFFAPNSIQFIRIPISKLMQEGSLKNLRLELVR